MAWKLFPAYGFPYGLTAYGEYREFDFNYVERLIADGAIVVKFLDSSGAFLHSFHSNTQNGFPINILKYSYIRRSPHELEITLLKDVEQYEFELFFDDIIEIYINSNTIPVWSGTLVQLPAETNNEQIFKYKFEGLKKRIESTIINRTYSSSTGINTIVDNIADDLVLQIPQLQKNTAKQYNPTKTITSLKFENQKGSDVLKKIEEIGANVEYGADKERQLYYLERGSTIDERFIFFAGLNCQDIEISQGDYSKIINRYTITKKASSGSGTQSSVTVNQATSQALYGIRAKKLDLPETTSDTDAALWGTGKIEYEAFPVFKASVRNIPFFKFLNQFVNKDLDVSAFGRLFSEEKWHYGIIDGAENISIWTSSDNTDFGVSAETNLIKENEQSLKVEATTSALNESCEVELANAIDMSSAKEITFWIRSTLAGDLLQFGIGEAAFSENLFDFTILQADQWQKVKINIESIADKDAIKYAGFKCVDSTTAFDFYADAIKFYWYGRQKYELEVAKVEVEFSPEKNVINIDFGSIDWPFTKEFIDATRQITALQAASGT